MPPRHSVQPCTVMLVRHGVTNTTGKVLPGRAPGLSLSDQGVRQATHAGERLATLGEVGAIYVSPLERTRQTAAPIAAALGVRPKVNRGLLECDFGDWTGRSLSQLYKLPEWSTVQRTPSVFRFPNGESFAEMQQRMITTVSALAAAHPGERIVCVSHADPIKAFITWCQGTHLDMFQRCVISPCSISVVVLSAPPMVVTVNSTGSDLSQLKVS